MMATEDVQISVITPSYNYGRFIGECLASVVAQKGVRYEHIVIDGQSTDDTARRVAEYKDVAFISEADDGMSHAINKGLAMAEGEWLMWLNADDRLREGALERLLSFAKRHPTADVVYAGWAFIDEAGDCQKLMSVFPFQRRMLAQMGCYIGSTACIFRRSATVDCGQLIDQSFRYVMDGEFYNRLAQAGARFEYCPAIVADFRQHGTNLSSEGDGADGLADHLAREHRWAESTAIRRHYGWTPFAAEHGNRIVDGLLYFYYRLKKAILKQLWKGRTELLPPVVGGQENESTEK